MAEEDQQATLWREQDRAAREHAGLSAQDVDATTGRRFGCVPFMRTGGVGKTLQPLWAGSSDADLGIEDMWSTILAKGISSNNSL